MEKITGMDSGKISLHGLGFVQIELPANKRLHVWHPDLPRRDCFEHSYIHDHRFGFRSTVLVGEQMNMIYRVRHYNDDFGKFIKYSHEGERENWGGRPWNAIGSIDIDDMFSDYWGVGQTYEMIPYVFHSTTPGGSGKTATLMEKTVEYKPGATSLCRNGVQPHVQFNRFQLSETELWNVVREVLTGS